MSKVYLTVCEVCENPIEQGKQDKSANIRWMHSDPAKCRDNIRADERSKNTECGICYALVAEESFSAHMEWHSERGDYS